jgi:hypothetical protein
MKKNAKISTDGKGNITLQDISGSTVTVNVNDPDKINELTRTMESNIAQQFKQFIKPLTDYSLKIPRELTLIPHINPENILGRENELIKLFSELFNNKKVVVVNGIGGIGKTTIAQAYIGKYYDSYKHFVWVSQTGNHASKAFLENCELLENLNIDISRIPEKEQLRVVLNRQRNIEDKPNLLVIDNADQTLCSFYQLLPGYPNWHVLITSREKLEHFDHLELSFLQHDKAIELFKKHCTLGTHQNINHISNLLKTVDYHTLTIEILAKTAQLQRISFDDLQIAIETDLQSKVLVDHCDNEIGNVKSYLKSIFKLTQLSKNQLWILKQFCFLPSEYHSFNLLSELLQINRLSWESEFSETIEKLCTKGWLLKNNETDSFKMHKIISEVTIDQLNIQFEDIQILVAKVADLSFFMEDVDNFQPKARWIPFGDTIIHQFEHYTEFSQYSVKE